MQRFRVFEEDQTWRRDDSGGSLLFWGVFAVSGEVLVLRPCCVFFKLPKSLPYLGAYIL